MYLIYYVIVCAIVIANCSGSDNILQSTVSNIDKRIAQSELKGNAECTKQLEVYKNKLGTTPLYDNNWAWQMFDASSKIPSGLLTGNFRDFGNFDECIDIDTIDSVDIKGKFCTSAIVIPLSMLQQPAKLFTNLTKHELQEKVATQVASIYLPSICIPHHCAPEDILTDLGLPKELAFIDLCITKDDIRQYDGVDWAFLGFMIIIFVCVIVSTLYDMYIKGQNKEPIHAVALAFSFYTNGHKLMKTSNNPGQISCLNGLRVLSMIWVIAGHRYVMSIYLPQTNLYESFQWAEQLYSQYIQAAPLAVDSFIFISGVVMSYGFITSQSKPNARFNVFMFYLHRYLRLTPAVAVLFFINISWVRHLGSGPQWEFGMASEAEYCRQSWWAYFLYIQNYATMEQVCLAHTWYLSLDMQIYIISPLLLIPLVKYPKYTLYVLGGLILVSVIPPIVTLYHYDADQNSVIYQKEYYTKTHNRISPWLVGVLLGYFLVMYKDIKIKMNKITNLAIWILVLIGMYLITHFIHKIAYNYDRTESAIYVGIHRMFWSVGLAWIVFACHKGYGGFINWLLSLPIFQVLARLSYSMYLVHWVVLLVTIYRKKTAIVWDDYELFNSSMGDVVAVTFVALFWTLLFESPMVVVEKIIFGGKEKAPKENKDLSNVA